MSVELIITRGSNRGTVAPIQQGYYLVGRHRECQIRPKSRSVSRRHCLLLRNEDGFGAFDLKSTRGTYVNGKRIEPHCWQVLHDGDEIHFGKVSFTVAIQAPALASASSVEQESSVSGGDSASETQVTPQPTETPESFTNFDVAQFLEEEDAVEFEQKYGKRPDGSATEQQNDLSVFNDTPLEKETFIGEVPKEEGDDDDEEDGDDEDESAGVEVEVDPQPRKPRQRIDHNSYKRSKKRSLSMPSLSFSGPADWRLIGAAVLVLLTCSFFVYQIYRFQAGPQIEIREGLD